MADEASDVAKAEVGGVGVGARKQPGDLFSLGFSPRQREQPGDSAAVCVKVIIIEGTQRGSDKETEK